METKFVDSNQSEIKVLLLEDDDGDAKAIVRAFQKARIANKIIRAIDGIEGLEILHGKKDEPPLLKPYVCLVDLNMPRMGGIEFLQEIRKDPKLKHAIAFVLTTSKKDEDMLAAYGLNVAGYIVKEKAGRDFLKVTELLDCYWRIVEMPI